MGILGDGGKEPSWHTPPTMPGVKALTDNDINKLSLALDATDYRIVQMERETVKLLIAEIRRLKAVEEVCNNMAGDDPYIAQRHGYIEPSGNSGWFATTDPE
jgi:hypothetical protein